MEGYLVNTNSVDDPAFTKDEAKICCLPWAEVFYLYLGHQHDLDSLVGAGLLYLVVSCPGPALRHIGFPSDSPHRYSRVMIAELLLFETLPETDSRCLFLVEPPAIRERRYIHHLRQIGSAEFIPIDNAGVPEGIQRELIIIP